VVCEKVLHRAPSYWVLHRRRRGSDPVTQFHILDA
jgi:hypothetical protein